MNNELITRLASLSKKKRKKNLVLFFGRENFSDNTKYLYLHTLSQERNFDVIWCSCQPELIKKLQMHQLPCQQIDQENVLECINLFMSAAVAVFSVNPSQSLNGNEALFACLEGARHIQLWHGVSVKHLQLKLMPHLDIRDYDFRRPIDFATRADCVLSTSSYLDDFFNESFSCRRIIRAGYPRNEVIVRKATELELIGSEITHDMAHALNNKKRKKVLFVPTWQRGPVDLITQSSKFLLQLIQICNHLQADVFIKNHPIYIDAGKSRALSSQAFYIAPGTDLYPWLENFDLLITDYSSIMFDFLLTGKPIMKLKLAPNEHQSFEPDYTLIPDISYAYDFDAINYPEVVLKALLNDDMQEKRSELCKILFETDAKQASTSLFKLIQHEVDDCVITSQRYGVEHY